MLTTDDFGLNEYVFKSSPESCSDRSYSSDFMDVTSDEDFITQLSTDLDIPLFLNPGEDELGLLNSFFDKSPEEIMAEITSPPPNGDEYFAKDTCMLQDVSKPSPESFPEINELQDIDILKCSPESFPNMQPEVKPEALSPCSVKSPNSMQPEVKPEALSPCSAKSPNSPRSPVYYDIKEEPTPTSPKSIILNHNDFPNNLIYAQPVQLVATPKVPLKQIPIVPKKPIPNSVNKGGNIVLIKPDVKPVITQASSIVILDNKSIPTIANTSTSSVVVRNTTTPVVVRKSVDCMETFSITGNIDPKAFKRQQRKIKNRESASLSRKRKKDYVASLEDQLKELNAENKRLQQENSMLKERLAQYEESVPSKPSNKAIKPGLFLCALLLVMGLNIDVLRSPFTMKQPVLMKNDMPKLADHHSRNLLWSTDDQVENKTSNFSPFFMCPAAINQTESARLVLELERWIGKPANVSGKVNLDKNETFTGKPKSRQRRRKYKSDGVVTSSYKRYRYKSGPQLPVEPKNEIQVFSLQPETTYSEFFEAINRQDDTFYVVSFTDQHMLLPALHHNKTRRPRMSLIMPSMLLNDTISQTSLIPLMQIDCEVLDTRMIHIKHGSIPQHLRAYGNATKKQPSDNNTSSDSTESKYYKKPYRPFFINKSMLKPDRDFLNFN